MAKERQIAYSRVAVRLMMAVGTAALLAGCSDASRFGDPFTDPFAGAPKSVASRGVDRAPTGSTPNRLMAPAHVESRPLAAPTATAARAPAPQPAPAPVAQTGGTGGSHWTADGGTPVTVGQGETAAILATRYGVPTDALLHANGYSAAAQVQPGARIVIPVYRANAVAHAAPAAAPAAPKVAEAKAEARPVAKAEPKPDPKAERAAAAAAREEAAKAERAKLAAAREEGAKAERARIAAREEAAKAERAKAAAREEEAKAERARAAAKAEEEKRARKVAEAKAAADAKAAEQAKAAKAAEQAKERRAAAEAKAAAEKAKLAEAKTAAEKARAAKAEAAAAEKARVAKAEAIKAEKKAAKAERLAKAAPARVEETAEAAPEPVAKTEKREAKVAAVEKPAEPAPSKAAEKAVDKTATASIPPAQTAQETKVAASDDGRPEFRWPARGRIIQGFSSGGNDGINIAVPEGTQVKAAEGGVVAYAGSELKGYGNLVLIRHPNGFVSAYAHNGELEVKRGDQVKRGQTIAKSGQSGNVGSPQLHFELRKGSTPVDPTSYLAGL